jgi:hypothetical protein
MSKDPAYDIAFGFPKGWVQLPVTNGKKIQHDKDLEAWAAKRAPATLGPGTPPDQVRQRARNLVDATFSCRARKDWYGLVFYSPGATGLVAALDIERYVPSRTYPEISLDALEKIYARQKVETVGEIDSCRTGLPSGPAIRVRGKHVEEAGPSGQGTITEELTYAICPPGLADAVVMTMTWTALQLGDKLAEMADAIARTIRVTSA